MNVRADRPVRQQRLPVRAVVVPSVTVLVALAAVPVAAQDPDSIPPVAQDTVQADSVAPPPVLPALDVRLPVGAGIGTWSWDRTALLNLGTLSVTDLLARLPGVYALRTGSNLQPEVASAFGGTAGRLEIEFNGVVLDPLLSGTFDLSTIELVDVDSIVVERRLDQMRVRIFSPQLRDPRPYSRVEAGTGEPNANLFRGMFMAPRFLWGPFSAAIERFDTNGAGVREPADLFAAWLRWGWQSDTRGIQLEFRNTMFDREPDVPWPEALMRQDLIVRARQQVTPGTVIELYGLSSKESTEPIEDAPAEDAVSGEREASQLGLRASYTGTLLSLDAALRRRNSDPLPRLEADFGGALHLFERIDVRADAEIAEWRAHPTTRVFDVRAAAQLLPSVSIFGEWSQGRRRAPVWPTLVTPEVDDTMDDGGDGTGDGGTGGGTGGGNGEGGEEEEPQPASTLSSFRTAFRGGAEVRYGRALLRAEAIRIEDDSVPPWRMPFDSAASSDGPSVRNGIQIYGLVALPGTAFSLEAVFNRWSGAETRMYLPEQTWTAALLLDASPLPSGNLGLIGRLELAHREDMLVPGPLGGGERVPVAGWDLLNGFFEIRIMDFRLFIRSDDILASEIENLPGRAIFGPRILYGIKWSFWN